MAFKQMTRASQEPSSPLRRLLAAKAHRAAIPRQTIFVVVGVVKRFGAHGLAVKDFPDQVRSVSTKLSNPLFSIFHQQQFPLPLCQVRRSCAILQTKDTQWLDTL